jgi:DNA-binding CsgD family transcriptional regulator/tetratricopeptide (TPR) repeat protein
MVGLLAQTCARAGRCRESVAQAARAVRVAADAGLSPGPGWFSSAVAELAGGTLARAEAFARQGARASEEEGDRNFLRCHLSVLGSALLRQGRAAEAVEALQRVQDIEDDAGLRDPSDLRWRADLVHALVDAGRLSEAGRALARHRDDVRALGRGRGVSAQLDRAEALLRLAQGDAVRALALAERSALRFAELGHPVEQGHSLLVQARAHAATGAHGAARSIARLARELFVAHGALPWVAQAEEVLSELVPVPPPAVAVRPLRLLPPVAETPVPVGVQLTDVETTVAGLVARGSSNREIAAALFVSVKTVEATLTRVYRKVGVRSRTQLSARLSGAR